jgi:conjugative relaxase-like TrwC/TraI family protein
MFTETYGRDPVDARELSGHLARISPQATTAVAGYDLSFSPVKRVSTLWAVAPREVAATIEQAHHDAVPDTITWLEKNATYSRRGKGGVAQVEVQGLIAATFTHRDSRAGDPDLHTHVAVSNKVQAKDDGQWLARDGRPLFKNNVAASSDAYNSRGSNGAAVLASRIKRSKSMTAFSTRPQTPSPTVAVGSSEVAGPGAAAPAELGSEIAWIAGTGPWQYYSADRVAAPPAASD